MISARFLATAKGSCDAPTWSAGVRLARSDALLRCQAHGDELEITLALPGQSQTLQICLYPQDLEWSCPCDHLGDCCAHVAAALIALHHQTNHPNRQGSSPSPLPQQAATPHKQLAIVQYHLIRSQGQLSLKRTMEQPDGTFQPLQGDLMDWMGQGPNRYVEPFDCTIDGYLQRWRHKTQWTRQDWQKLWPLLQQSQRCFLDDRPIRIGDPGLPLNCRVVAQQGGATLQIVPSKVTLSIWPQGCYLADAHTLQPLQSLPEQVQTWVQTYQHPQFFAPKQFASLFDDILPVLKSWMPVQLQGIEEPQALSMPLRLEVHLEQPDVQTLTLLPVLHYGQPPMARLEGDTLVLLQPHRRPLRNKDQEQRWRDQLETLGCPLNRRSSHQAQQAIHVLATLRALPGSHLSPETLATRWQPDQLQLRPNLEYNHGQWAVTFQGNASSTSSSRHEPFTQGGMPNNVQIQAEQVLQAWREQQTLVPLDIGGFATLPMDWLQQYGEILEAFLAAKATHPTLNQAHWIGFQPLLEQLPQPVQHPNWPSIAQLWQQAEQPLQAMLPPDLLGVLRDYQQEGVAWLQRCQKLALGALLADDMGLGKTLQIIASLPTPGPHLIIAPTSVVPNWQQELRKFRPQLGCTVYHGSQRQLDPSSQVVLTSYGLLRRDLATLAAVDWQTIVLDEAHTIKNDKSQLAQAAYQLKGHHRIAMTGTPIENHLLELWSQFQFLNPGLLGSKSQFQQRFCEPQSQQARQQLKILLQPFLKRRTKQQVASTLPPRTEMSLYCHLSPPERQLYQALQLAARSHVLQQIDQQASPLSILESLLRLRQACNHPNLLPGQPPFATSSKLDLLLQQLSQCLEGGHKALVFSQWTGWLDLVQRAITNRLQVTCCRLDGQTQDRSEQVARFQDPKGPPIMLLSLKAGGVGLNLTAADHVFLLDPWWNPASEAQAADRAHRIGQTKPVFVYKLIAKDTVEERIVLLQQHKKALAADILEGPAPLGSLSRSQWLALLEETPWNSTLEQERQDEHDNESETAEDLISP